MLEFHSSGIHEHPRVKHVSICFVYIYIDVQNDTMCDVRKIVSGFSRSLAVYVAIRGRDLVVMET